MKPEKNKVELDFQLNSYNYILDPALIANEPKEIRHKSRMMVVRNSLSQDNCDTNKLTENIIDELSSGDLIVVNDTKVMKARLQVMKENGYKVELLVLENKEDSIWLCLAKPAKKIKIKDIITLNSLKGNIKLKVVGIDNETGGRYIQFPDKCNSLQSMDKLLEDYGEMPLPPYIKKTDQSMSHESRYQTKFAKYPGAVAAPTAGLHLSNDILQELKKRGVKVLPITLHVGYGTFKPISKDNLTNLKLHKEFVKVDENVIDEIKIVKKKGNRVIAVGTTSVRALESCYCPISKRIIPIEKDVDLVIKPGFQFKVVDGLLTNFHLPKSSLLLLVSAMIGRERLLKLYKKAIEEKFRFFSYGDAMYVSPEAFLETSKFRP